MTHSPEAETVADHYRQRGFQHVHVREDHPNYTYHTHYHAHEVTLHVITGELSVVTNHHTQTARAGQQVVIPAEQIHTTAIGPEGSVYIHAEQPHQRR